MSTERNTTSMHKQSTGTALVTGASAGLGSLYADRLARRGYDLILVARRQDRLDALASELNTRYGRRARALAADLGNAADLESVVQTLTGDDTISLLK